MVSATPHYNMGRRRVSLHLLKQAQHQPVATPAVSMATRADNRRVKQSANALTTSKFQKKENAKQKNEAEKKKLQKEGVTCSWQLLMHVKFNIKLCSNRFHYYYSLFLVTYVLNSHKPLGFTSQYTLPDAENRVKTVFSWFLKT